jgi:acetolactate synthase small subunit
MLNRVIYLVTAQDHPDVVPRTVMLLHRLAVPIGSLRVKRPEKSPVLRLTVEVEVIAGQADRIAENLRKIVYVTSVEISRRPKHRSSVAKVGTGKGP